MTEPEGKHKVRLSLDEQIRLMEQTGGYHRSPEVLPPPIGSTPPKRSYEQAPEPIDPNAGTGPVQPSLVHVGTWVPYANTFSGRGNDAERSAGFNIPPRVAGLSLPMPTQLTGSNQPGSTITQAPSVLAQSPVIPSASNPQQVPPEFQKRPGSPYGDVGRDALKDDNPSYPTLNPTNGQQGGVGGVLDGGTTPGQGNPYPPFGNLAPKTAGGASATPSLDDLRKQLAAQLEKPVVIAPGLTQERSYTDPSHASAFKSALLQPVPMEHQFAGTTRQSPVAMPQSQVTRYPGDFNQPQPVSMKKSAASDSAGVQKVFPPGWADAGVPKKKVISPIVETDRGT